MHHTAAATTPVPTIERASELARPAPTGVPQVDSGGDSARRLGARTPALGVSRLARRRRGGRSANTCVNMRLESTWHISGTDVGVHCGSDAGISGGAREITRAGRGAGTTTSRDGSPYGDARNLTGIYSDARSGSRPELRIARCDTEALQLFSVPSAALRGVGRTPDGARTPRRPAAQFRERFRSGLAKLPSGWMTRRV